MTTNTASVSGNPPNHQAQHPLNLLFTLGGAGFRNGNQACVQYMLV